VDGGQAAVVPVGVNVRRKEDGCRERRELDRCGDEENNARTGETTVRKRVEADEVGGERCRGSDEVEPRPGGVVSFVVGNEGRARGIRKRERSADESERDEPRSDDDAGRTKRFGYASQASPTPSPSVSV
jgi:hypothetical protein